MKPSLVLMIRLWGSVKLRCALRRALAESVLRPRGARRAAPRRPAPASAPVSPRSVASRHGGRCRPAAACASASSAALASRIFARRAALSAPTPAARRRAAPTERGVVGRVRRLGRRSQPATSAASALRLNHAAVAHRLVLGRVGLDPGAVERTWPSFTKPAWRHKVSTWTNRAPSACRWRSGNR